jgi:putative sporulation protein YtaF
MDWLLPLFLALAANIDNLGVGIAYGSRKIKISLQANLIIALLSFIATLLAAEAGSIISQYIRLEVASDLGAIVIIIVGLWIIIEPAVAAHRQHQVMNKLPLATRSFSPTALIHQPEKADIDCSADIDTWEAVILGMALSVNAVAGGLDAGLVALPMLVVAMLVGVFSFLTIASGIYFGRKYVAERMGHQATRISGILMLVIGLHQLCN